MKLFDLIPEVHALNSLIEENDGEILNEEAEKALEAFFAEIAHDEAAKLDSYVNVVRLYESKAAAAQAEIDQYQARKRAAENAARRLKDRVKLYLEITNRTKVGTVTGRTLAIQKNGGLSPLDVDASVRPEDLPEQFQKVVVSVDSDKVRAALEAGEVLEFARLKSRGTHLRIR